MSLFGKYLEIRKDTDLDERINQFGVDVKDFGAKGDSIQDDYASISRAMSYMKKIGGGTLYFPSGKYRIGRSNDRTRDFGGIHIEDISNIKIEFSPDAVLWMDNLNPITGAGDQCEGVMVKGNVDNLILINVAVEWSTYPTSRSTGDGMYFWGGVDPDACPRNIKLINCRVKNTPQAGVIFQGCRDIMVINLKIDDTRADGLHFNANHRHIFVDGVTGKNVGDDCVAFVTYYNVNDPTNPYVYSNGRPPFNSPDITTRNNNHSFARNITVNGINHGNGVRISGGYDITVENVKSIGRSTGVTVDSALADGTTILWTYLASQRIRVKGVTSTGDNVGAQVIYSNQGQPDTSTWPNELPYSKFDVEFEDIDAKDNILYGIFLSRVRGVKIKGYNKSNKEIRIRNVRDIEIEHLLAYDGALIQLIGKDDAFGYPLITQTPNCNIRFGTVEVRDGNQFNMFYVGGVHIDTFINRNANARALVAQEVVGATIGKTIIEYPNRMNATDYQSNAIHNIRTWNFFMSDVTIRTDANRCAIDVGGASLSTDGLSVTDDITNGFVIQNGTMITDRADKLSNITPQGGVGAAQNVNINLKYLNRGETAPVWRVYGRTTVSKGPTEERPNGGATFVSLGFEYFDTNENRPYRHTGSDNWVKSDTFRSGSTSNRNIVATQQGESYFDTSLGKIIYVKTVGARQVETLTITSPVTQSGNITITLNGTAFNIPVVAGDSIDNVTTKIRAKNFTGWLTDSPQTSGVVKFTSITSGTKASSGVYSAGTTGATGTIATTTSGTADFWVDSNGVAPENKGANITVNSGASIRIVGLPVTEPDANYIVDVAPAWNTTWWISAKATNQFTISFGTLPASATTLDWSIRR
jgi:hypothetical protein